MSPKLFNDQIGTGDQSWIGQSGPWKAGSGSLLKSAFSASTHYPNGYIPSGLPVSKIAAGPNIGKYGPAGSRTVADGATTNTSTTLTSATAAFGTGDVGAVVSGTGIPAGTTIASVTNATTAVMSAAATATATGVSITVNDALSGFVLTDSKVTSDLFINAPIYDRGRVNINKLPVSFTVPVPDNGHFEFVTQTSS